MLVVLIVVIVLVVVVGKKRHQGQTKKAHARRYRCIAVVQSIFRHLEPSDSNAEAMACHMEMMVDTALAQPVEHTPKVREIAL